MSKHKKEIQEQEKEEKCKQCEEYLAGWQRAKADYENLQKQTAREKEEFVKFANLNLIIQFIPVYNHLKLSFEHLQDEFPPKAPARQCLGMAGGDHPLAEKYNDWVKGIEQIKKQFKQVLEENGVEEIAPKVGDEFNPELHEAVEHEELRIKNSSFAKAMVDKQELRNANKNKIEKVVSCGYKLSGKVIVPARVMVE